MGYLTVWSTATCFSLHTCLNVPFADVGQHGFDEYEAVASAYMPSDLSKQELSFAVASLRNTFHKTRQRSTSSSLESFVRAIVASSAVFASRAQIPTPTDGMLCPVDANDSMCNDLQIQMGNLWKQLKDLSDEEESILASMRTVQPSLFIDADSLARVKSIMQDAREAESFLKDCTEHIECLKQQELLSASRKQADGKIAESGLEEVQHALMLCVGQQVPSEQ